MGRTYVVFIIVGLNCFINGILTVILPLMMKERSIDIITIGVVFASMPIMMQSIRMVFAIVSDFWGRRPFFVLNGVTVIIASLVYSSASTPLEFLSGKFMEGTKEGSLWAVNRAFLLDKGASKWENLVRLRTATFISIALGSLLAGFLILWLLYEGTLLLCALIGAFIVPLSLLLIDRKREKFNLAKALHLLDFRRKTKTFKTFMILFFMFGLSLGFRSGFIFPLFLRANHFDVNTIGVVLALQFLLAGLFSYFFATKFQMRKLILVSGILNTVTLILIGFSSSIFAGILIVAYGIICGLLSIVHEGIFSRIMISKESYGIDVGLLNIGLHSGNTIGLATSGFLVSIWGFVAPFLMSASVFMLFSIVSSLIVKDW